MTKDAYPAAQPFSRSLCKTALLALAIGFLFDVVTILAALTSVDLRQLNWVFEGGFWIWESVLKQGAHSATGVIAVMGLNWLLYSLAVFLFGLGVLVIKRLDRQRGTGKL